MEEKLAGVNSIIEALKGRRKVSRILVQEGRHGKRIEELLELAQKKGVHVQSVEKKRLDQMYTQGNHQGVIASVDAYTYSTIDEVLEAAASKKEKPFLLILDGIEDPRNFGAMIRTAVCAGVHGIVVPKHNSVHVNEVVARSSAGAVEHVHIVQETNLVNTIKYLKKAGLWVAGADMQAEMGLYQTSIEAPIALVIGGEGKGLRRLVRENCDIMLKIPIKGEVNSLNASVAAALIMYEVVRQQERNSL